MSERGRDGGSEAPESTTGEDLVSLLYGELEPDEAERAGARIASDQELTARLGDMRRVRELFCQMVDEEPPSRLTAQLMAEAARSAPQTRAAAAPAQAGFWARFVSWLQPVVQRPSLAAACSLLLVAGVASLLYMRKGEELTSTAPTTAVDSTTATGEIAEPPAAPPPPPVSAATPADTSGANLEGDAERSVSDDGTAEKADSGRGAKPMAKRSKSASTAPGGGKAYDKAPAKPTLKTGTVYGLSEQEMVPAEEPKAANQAGPTGGASAPPQQKAEPPPPAAAEPAPAPSAPRSDSKAPRPDVRELHKRAIDAALDNRCPEVRTLAGQVRATHTADYAKSFAGDKRLKSCLSSGSPKAPAKK
jgi:hypothetical protein